MRKEEAEVETTKIVWPGADESLLISLLISLCEINRSGAILAVGAQFVEYEADPFEHTDRSG